MPCQADEYGVHQLGDDEVDELAADHRAIDEDEAEDAVSLGDEGTVIYESSQADMDEDTRTSEDASSYGSTIIPDERSDVSKNEDTASAIIEDRSSYGRGDSREPSLERMDWTSGSEHSYDISRPSMPYYSSYNRDLSPPVSQGAPADDADWTLWQSQSQETQPADDREDEPPALRISLGYLVPFNGARLTIPIGDHKDSIRSYTLGSVPEFRGRTNDIVIPNDGLPGNRRKISESLSCFV